MSESVRGNLVEKYDDLKKPGDFLFTTRHGSEAPAGMMFCCPGCGTIGHLRIYPDDAVDGHDMEHPSWRWNGNRNEPTLTPSIQKTSGCLWRGYLRAGVFEPC